MRGGLSTVLPAMRSCVILSVCLTQPRMPIIAVDEGSREQNAAAVGEAEGILLDTAPLLPWPAASSAALRDDGCVFMPKAVSPSTVVALRSHCESELATKLSEVASGVASQGDHFGAVLARSSRHDLKLALTPLIEEALSEVLGSIAPLVRGTLECAEGEEPVLAELGAIYSTDGAPRQPLHSDTYRAAAPQLLTAFVALQDITPSMGPTTFLPGTHRDELAHAAILSPSLKADFLLSRPKRLGVMPAGACTLYDSRLLHAGGANHDRPRWLFYAGFTPSRTLMRELRGKQYEPLQRAAHTLSQLEGRDAGGESDAELEAMWAALLRPRDVLI